MKVQGYEVTPEIENACLSAMQGEFRALQIAQAAIRAGVPDRGSSIPDRVADRLLQRERKAGRIKRVGNRWLRVKGIPEDRNDEVVSEF